MVWASTPPYSEVEWTYSLVTSLSEIKNYKIVLQLRLHGETVSLERLVFLYDYKSQSLKDHVNSPS
jgi:hypothetical protein